MLRTRRTLFSVLLVAALAGCGGSQASDPVPDDVGRAADRLQGEWVLTAFQPARSLEPIVDAILAANPAQVEQYRGGKDGLLGFFVGQVMKETKGEADARAVNELVRAKLGA